MEVDYIEALEILNRACPLPTGVVVYIAPSTSFPMYGITTVCCYTVTVNGILIYAIDTDEEKLKYFVGRAKQLTRII